MKRKYILWACIIFPLLSMQPPRPTVYIIGDSTVRNTHEVQQGWGSHLADYLDTSRVRVDNNAMAGRSTRTFIKEGRWAKVCSLLHKGDYVLIQFGHNEGSEPDTTRAGYRGVLRGTGDEAKQEKVHFIDLNKRTADKYDQMGADEEAKEIYNPITRQQETVYTYGRYLAAFVQEAKSKGATVYICSPIPRNNWKGGTVATSTESYPQWAKQIAEQQDAYYIDLHERIVTKYNGMGSAKVQAYFTEADHTHTNETGARMNAKTVAETIASLVQNPLKEYLKLN
ncbi:rhamnogalacturonan acetylesterase [Parapedobacter tibetensis]|uniref:rhamnogalacturonan acetylesterase n=1 Tax=Parapedobacter tibetensis TaxID=2972951 RepID=UPI00214DDD94|nr:rhamnogalacturonan acetylesterase [Parapedobacter tibetensis]